MPTVLIYLLIFLLVGIAFVFVNLTLGSLLRPRVKNVEKDIPYECGEDPVGSAWVQFDLRFYVVALLFVIFEVELVFFFPWATLFGKLNAASVPEANTTTLTPALAPQAPPGTIIDPGSANMTAWLVFAEMLVFFMMLLVAYAYLWRRGDLNWVRASAVEQARQKTSLPMV
ncbi:MAG: NADH-quinone oxidoreductase subunit A [Gemmatales bacterium]